MKKQSTIIKVLIVEDSLTARQYLEHIIASDPQLEVVGTAKDGEESVKLVKLKHPDIVTMDIYMPKMNGYEATQKIMVECPTPIVIVTSSRHPDDVGGSFRAIDVGALAVLEKPPGPGHPKSKALAVKLVQTIKTMAEVRVVRRLPKQKKQKDVPAVLPPAGSIIARKRVEVVAIGASTGGPPALKNILSGLKQEFPVPVLIVQHITTGFLGGMVEWLGKTCELSIQIASDGEHIRKGIVYFAPDCRQMGVTGAGRIVLKDDPVENNVRPSVSHLFRFVADAYGERSVGVLLTGMGKDGAPELARMKEKGAITIAQDKESCVVYGMPGEAVKLNGAKYVLSLEKITRFLNSINHPKGNS